ncbi:MULTISPECIES: tRNA uridine(34) 5-carboxymethylaminomethyl modification radical SAM/GNAT enzyme Elp3 [Methanobacterium]|uniref:tRNA carboxymethyluridine synthase n=1 Tax=Methanobacterium subterraneum TaxID=59277 RepID=A0A2H4VES6_9EURY|nr:MULTISPECIES: tRNA uridine(34) 5-carboxymethylaminomethyl modification radical SAM/GNAT enzyme Elp3 [Methanobacterium]AUB56605.1 tRNA uridine(34) 5-carboxymethylaminomethyl modification radical SAM/GNAT enzyme Elp3 [Methanobacterium subterraneum]AUB59158.1 tRNA uridine(34) 5-carboxymethylaminomethyl modification radical SAM/GNAT enzyme Elp3 [Methanobacterium sp. MZ-A1]NMO09610.1 tRNA uridine(34) 5-carboxymethylaminomethyl modification radical SAM/GNAT enzyme Elp3 [Methanobacterium subterraneu
MEKAGRSIIKDILSGKIKNRKDLEKAKFRVCRDYKLDRFPRNSEILQTAQEEEKELVIPILKKKPTRTISGVAVVAVMCPPHNCPHGRCLYCPESTIAPPSYTGEEPAALRARMYDFSPYKQVYNRLQQLESIGHPLDKVELIIMGGTFPSRFLCFQEWFITQCLQAMTDFGVKEYKLNSDEEYTGGNLDLQGFQYLEDVQLENENSSVRCVGMTFETRPDYSRREDVDRMLQMGVTRVELGVQTIYNFIYHRVERGHRVEDTIKATRVLKDSGIKVAMHLMPGLFSDQERDLRIFKRLFSDERFKPDMLKIYPCLVTKGSKLYELWEKGEYTPYTSEEAVKLIVEVKKILPKWVRTMRIQRDIPSQLIEAGVQKSNLGELVYNQLKREKVQCQCIRCREVGHQAAHGTYTNKDNVQLLMEKYRASEGEEIFLSMEDAPADVLLGFLRLRMPSEQAHRPEISHKSALVRELHVYGPMIPLGEREDDLWQHRGYGEELLKKAEEISREEYDKKEILIISGIGARNYYRKFGYKRKGPYMAKKLV